MSQTPANPCWTVALTGGIAAGKSAVGRAFENHGIHVHDADLAAREVVAPGTDGLAAIVAAFGHDVLAADGTLDRRAMRHIVFADATARRRLEAIVHPRVNAWLRDKAATDRGAYCVLAIPLLVETWPQYAWVDRVATIEAPHAARIARLTARDGIDATTAERMLATQASDADRRAIADDVIDNSGDLATLEQAVATLHARYLALAKARQTSRP
ncbi:MAG TPA: dephospho-CoA kinase [Rhodanobacteraceae bacterium]